MEINGVSLDGALVILIGVSQNGRVSKQSDLICRSRTGHGMKCKDRPPLSMDLSLLPLITMSILGFSPKPIHIGERGGILPIPSMGSGKSEQLKFQNFNADGSLARILLLLLKVNGANQYHLPL